jgi:DNA-binding LytR/AlgR family response regulator
MIVEDEGVLREELAERLAKLWPELEIVTLAADGNQALAALSEQVPDVIFLDIRLPGASGLDVARAIDGRSHVVFMTAFDAHAVEAFETGAVDYVLKPFDDQRLSRAIRRLKSHLASPAPPLDDLLERLAAQVAPRQHLRWINASQGREVRLITVEEVCYFQADAKYTRVVTADGESLIRKSLKELAEELDPAKFWPIHRATIVNADTIAAVGRNLSGDMVIRLKNRPERLTVSEAHRKLFRQM